MEIPRDYVEELRNAYEKFYRVIKEFGMHYIESNFKIPNPQTRKFLNEIINMLPEPAKASVFEMIAIGFEVTYGAYEFFYWIDESGKKAVSREERVAYLLQRLTVDNENLEIKKLIEDFKRAYRIVRDAWHSYGKLQPHLERL